jgi:hypothetical protein
MVTYNYNFLVTVQGKLYNNFKIKQKKKFECIINHTCGLSPSVSRDLTASDFLTSKESTWSVDSYLIFFSSNSV